MPEPDTQQTLLAGWDTPFPPEKPRRDAPEAPAVEDVPTGAAVAAATYTGGDVATSYRQENRRRLDGRRLCAHIIDNVLLIPLAIVVFILFGENLSPAAFVMAWAVELTYYFLFETLRGQTPGKKAMKLRVVRMDGTGASASKIAGRTIFRFFDYTILGLIVYIATGGRRQRIGDLAADTIVRPDDAPFKPAPESPLLVVYPLLWFAGAFASIAVLPGGSLIEQARNDHPYMARIDRICEKRARMMEAWSKVEPGNVLTARTFLRQETRKIEKLPKPPPEVRGEVREVRRMHRELNRAIDRMIADARRTSGDPTPVIEQHADAIQAMAAGHSERYLEMGLPYCAS